ncbi:MAG TPA: hypothetical protein VKB84_26370 [Candidatus Binataceae bacterium]|jgi:hypothetical protein|nr:hypothetical protein [Candidatus Binataceae bacterium]
MAGIIFGPGSTRQVGVALQRGVNRAGAAAIDGSAPTPTVDLVDLEAPTATKPEAGDLAALYQPIDSRLVAVQILGQILHRYDFPGHFLIQHNLTPFKFMTHRALAGGLN